SVGGGNARLRLRAWPRRGQRRDTPTGTGKTGRGGGGGRHGEAEGAGGRGGAGIDEDQGERVSLLDRAVPQDEDGLPAAPADRRGDRQRRSTDEDPDLAEVEAARGEYFQPDGGDSLPGRGRPPAVDRAARAAGLHAQ